MSQGAIRTNFENNTKTAKNYKPESSPYASTVQKLFEGVQSITANSSHPRDVAEVVLKVVNTSYPNVRYPVGKDAESVLKKRAELSDMEMEKWVSEKLSLKRKALYVNGLLGKEQSRHDFRLPFLIIQL